MLTINLPSIQEQRAQMLKIEADINCQKIQHNLTAPHYPRQEIEDLDSYSKKHLLTESEGWEVPHCDVIRTLFEQFQAICPDYNSDNKLAVFLGLKGDQAGRRVREYKTGEKKIPYDIWRRFLVSTGRASQEIIPVLGVFDLD